MTPRNIVHNADHWTIEGKPLFQYSTAGVDAFVVDMMHGALHDLYVYEDHFKEGDTFALDGVVLFRCDPLGVVRVTG